MHSNHSQTHFSSFTICLSSHCPFNCIAIRRMKCAEVNWKLQKCLHSFEFDYHRLLIMFGLDFYSAIELFFFFIPIFPTTFCVFFFNSFRHYTDKNIIRPKRFGHIKKMYSMDFLLIGRSKEIDFGSLHEVKMVKTHRKSH